MPAKTDMLYNRTEKHAKVAGVLVNPHEMGCGVNLPPLVFLNIVR